MNEITHVLEQVQAGGTIHCKKQALDLSMEIADFKLQTIIDLQLRKKVVLSTSS